MRPLPAQLDSSVFREQALTGESPPRTESPQAAAPKLRKSAAAVTPLPAVCPSARQSEERQAICSQAAYSSIVKRKPIQIVRPRPAVACDGRGTPRGGTAARLPGSTGTAEQAPPE